MGSSSSWRPPPPQPHYEHSPATRVVAPLTVDKLEAQMFAAARNGAENASSKPRSSESTSDFSRGDSHSARWANLGEAPPQSWPPSRDASSRGSQDAESGPLKNILSRFSSPAAFIDPARPTRGTTSELSGAYLATVPTTAHSTSVMPAAPPV